MNGGYDEIKNEFASYHNGYNIDECLKSMREKYSQDQYSAYEFVFTKCFVDHDGYDRYGPKSNLYDLYVFFKRKSVDAGVMPKQIVVVERTFKSILTLIFGTRKSGSQKVKR